MWLLLSDIVKVPTQLAFEALQDFWFNLTLIIRNQSFFYSSSLIYNAYCSLTFSHQIGNIPIKFFPFLCSYFLSKPWMGKLYFTRDQSDVCNILCGPYKIVTLRENNLLWIYWILSPIYGFLGRAKCPFGAIRGPSAGHFSFLRI